MILSFRKTTPRPVLTSIKGADIELVDSYKYLGVILDNKLCFESHVVLMLQRLFFLRKMCSFNIFSEMMTLFV